MTPCSDPASDGGFWLFGLNKTARTKSPFAPSVRWSGPHALWRTFESQLAKRRARGAELPTLIDLDEAEDWQPGAIARPPKLTRNRNLSGQISRADLGA